MIEKLITLGLLAGASVQDRKEKEIWIGFPIAVLIIGLIWRFFNIGNIMYLNGLIVSVGLILLSVVGGGWIGLGDALLFVGLIPICGVIGLIRIIVDSGIVMLLVYKLIIKGKEKEVAYVPYILVGFFIWMVI